MRRLLTGPLDTGDVGASLRVIAAFDDCLSAGGTVLDLALLAAGLLGRHVTVRDDLNDHILSCGPDGPVAFEDETRARAQANRIAIDVRRGAQAAALTVDAQDVLAATVEHAGGRLGVVWTDRVGPDALVLDELILERLARSVASRFLHDQEQARPREPGRADALERLLVGDLSHDMLGSLCRRARIDANAAHRVAVLVGRPPGASPEVLLARAKVDYAVSDDVPSCVVGRAAALLLPEKDATLGRRGAAHDVTGRGWQLVVGISRPHPVGDLPAALLEGRRVVALSTGSGGVERADDVGALLLLASVPSEVLRSDEDVRRAELLLEPDRHHELMMLDTYCLTGSLRKTAEQLYLHHSSVDYHLKRLEQDLGFEVSSRAGQLRALLAIRLARLVHAGLGTEAPHEPPIVGEPG